MDARHVGRPGLGRRTYRPHRTSSIVDTNTKNEKKQQSPRLLPQEELGSVRDRRFAQIANWKHRPVRSTYDGMIGSRILVLVDACYCNVPVYYANRTVRTDIYKE